MLRIFALVTAIAIMPVIVAVQSPDAATFVQDGQKLLDQGNLDGAVEKFRAAVSADPQRYEAQDALGKALDLAGRYPEAREHLERAISLAPDGSKNQALAAMGTSFAFEARPEDAARYYRSNRSTRRWKPRIWPERPGPPTPWAASTWNQGTRRRPSSGIERGTRQPDASRTCPPPSSPCGTCAGHTPRAGLRRVAASVPRRFSMPLSSSDCCRPSPTRTSARPIHTWSATSTSTRAITRRQSSRSRRAAREDVFVLGLIAESYRKLHDAPHAREYFERVLAGTGHNINAAFSRPAARLYLKRPPS